MLKRTSLYAIHAKLGGRFVDFAGWEMPLYYAGIIEEHHAVRTAAGLFDISHMGQFRVTGPHSSDFLNQILTNDLRKSGIGWGQYTLMCNDHGGVIDDLFLYCLAEQEYLMVVNASRMECDFSWISTKMSQFFSGKGVELENLQPHSGALAVQGPRASEFIDAVFDGSLGHGAGVPRIKDLKKRQWADFSLSGVPVWVARTGYTGEDGFELFASAESMPALWNRILEEGRSFGLRPAGLGARDTLRLEAGYPLFGHELDEQKTPIEAGLTRFVAFEKPNFIGRDVMTLQVANGVRQKLVAFKLTAKAPPPRPGYAIWNVDSTPAKIGQVVSGSQSPSLGIGIGMGYVTPDYARTGTTIAIEIRGNRVAAEIVPKPIYRSVT